MSSYPHRLTITRPGPGGGTDPRTGDPVPGGGDVTVYDDGADVQDGEVAIATAADGTPTKLAQAKVFLRDESKITQLAIGDTGNVSGGLFGSGRGFEVVGFRLLDGLTFLNWLGSPVSA